MTKESTSNMKPFSKITIPDEDIPKPKLRLLITVILTIFCGVLILFDQFLGMGTLEVYWILFAAGLIGCCMIIGLVLFVNQKTRMKGEETWLEKWGEEIGWPLMILAFTIQFLFPVLRPFLVGAILGGSWSLVIWHLQRRQVKS